ncbi:vancomycin resistance protein VanW [Chryseobacterium scophthalmum]|uniref:Vancomycin resistance protein VanW n=2 Tax=Chryseobacterium scophthalmum TaxID=59733 RepID=A0A1N6J5K8_9FLAO|nr:vancomycin resistance protein VanW [Chryseobacterium scophthalmum]
MQNISEKMGILSNCRSEKTMKQFIKDSLPYQWKLQYRLLQRFFHEQKSNHFYSKIYSENDIGNHQTEFKQTIRKGDFYENKIHNLKIASEKINNLIIQPNEVFSFWKTVGKPSKQNNFKEGRNLIKNNISQDFGGGICQFSSILYYSTLQFGLEILERHPHSVDIYKEDERFTPLGSDSTVVFGYKDLQIKNNFPFPVQFKCRVHENQLCFTIISQNEIKLNTINFKYHEIENGVWVETLINDRSLFKNFYIRL